MEYDPQDNDVIHLLKKLRDSHGTYPPEMLALRREGYLRQVAEISGAAGLLMGLKNAAKHGKAASLPPTAGTVVEALLIVALVAEAGAVTYFYRDKVAEYVRSATNSPKVEEVSPPPIRPSPSLIAEIEATLTPTPIVTAATVSETPAETGTPVSTPSPELAEGPKTGTDPTNKNQAGPTVKKQAVSTQAPQDDHGKNGNNGNHYGQTPKPERTKDAGNNNTTGQESSTSKPKSKP